MKEKKTLCLFTNKQQQQIMRLKKIMETVRKFNNNALWPVTNLCQSTCVCNACVYVI